MGSPHVGSEAQNDNLTCTTKATVQPESDEENVTEQCPSPVPFKGSNAVSPEGENQKPGFRKQQEEQEGADMLKVHSLPQKTQRQEYLGRLCSPTQTEWQREH